MCSRHLRGKDLCSWRWTESPVENRVVLLLCCFFFFPFLALRVSLKRWVVSGHSRSVFPQHYDIGKDVCYEDKCRNKQHLKKRKLCQHSAINAASVKAFQDYPVHNMLEVGLVLNKRQICIGLVVELHEIIKILCLACNSCILFLCLCSVI